MSEPIAVIKNLFLELLPEDGASLGNQALLATIRKTLPEISDTEYQAAREALVSEGKIQKGRGRGGSVSLAPIGETADDESGDASEFEEIEDDGETGDTDDEGDEDDGEDFALEMEEPQPAATRSVRARKAKRKAKPSGPARVLSYRHGDTRVNNPEVGMVHPDNDPDQPRTVWATIRTLIRPCSSTARARASKS